MDHSLAAYLQDGPADSSILRIFHGVLKAINAIHAAGSSHVPLSPQTIRFDDSDEPRIQSRQRAHEMADTVAFGSAKYSAPEAFSNNGESASCELVDCYVLGFIFYEILVGKRLFAAQFASLEDGPPSFWLKWHADKTARASPLTELRPSLGHFAVVIDGMIEKDPAKRISSISQVLQGFSSVEVQTAYNVAAVDRLGARSGSNLFRNKFLLAGFRKPGVAGGLLLAIALVVSAALLMHHKILSSSVKNPPPKELPDVRQPVAKAAANAESLLSASRQNAQIQSSRAASAVESAHARVQSELKLQIDSHLEGDALLFVDHLRPAALSRHGLFTAEITPGPHNIRVVTGARAFLKLSFDAAADGEISFLETPRARLLRGVMLASNAKSTQVYATSAVLAGVPGRGYEPVPEEGRVIANNQIFTVSLGKDSKNEIHFNPLPPGSLRIVLEPSEAASWVAVDISANVPDATIVINGETLRHKLDNGVRTVRLPAGEYRVKLIRADYRDSAEQNLVIGGNEQRCQMQFTLVPIASFTNTLASSIPAHESREGRAAEVGAQPAKPLGKITFHVEPQSAQINCRREGDPLARNCANNQPCLLEPGGYDVTLQAQGYKTEVNHFAIGAGEDKPYEWRLAEIPPPPALNPSNFFENGRTWTVDPDGWWIHTQPGYSFMRANQGVFVFDILKPAGLFASRKVSLVVDYKGEGNRVLYTIDEHKLQRYERAPGIQIANYSIANESSSEANYRLRIELSTGRVIIRNAAGQVLDNLPLPQPAAGKVGFSGKLKLKVIEAKYPQ